MQFKNNFLSGQPDIQRCLSENPQMKFLKNFNNFEEVKCNVFFVARRANGGLRDEHFGKPINENSEICLRRSRKKKENLE